MAFPPQRFQPFHDAKVERIYFWLARILPVNCRWGRN
jgi:hypothetical protein